MTGRAYGGESSQERLDRRRRQLLDAGLEVFGTTGYRSATVRQLCREAGLTDRYFYEQFAQTEDLLLAVYAECMDQLAAATTSAVEQVDAGTDIGGIATTALTAFLKVVEDDPRLARVVWSEVLGVSARVEEAYMARMASFGAFITDVLVVRENRTPRSDIDSETLSQAAVGGVSHAVMSWVDNGFKPRRRRMVSTLSVYLAGIAEAATA